MEDARTPLGDEARHAFAEVIGADGASLLDALADAAAPHFLSAIPAVLHPATGLETELHLDPRQDQVALFRGYSSRRTVYRITLRCRGALQ